MLKISKLKKSYGNFVALDGLDMELGKGRIFGFVGPNGAGKTTTMKIIAGLLKADSGEIWIEGINARKDIAGLREVVGYMPDSFGVYDNLKVTEYMEFYAQASGLDGFKARQIYMDLLELVNLGDKVDFYVDSLSRGMKQRLCFARALIHDPSLVILDEPASGLDPRTRFELKDILKNLRERGKTILISSHILSELSEMCTDIGIVEHGKMVITGTMEEILQKVNVSKPLVIHVCGETEKAVALLRSNPLVQTLTAQLNKIQVGYHGGKEAEAMLLQHLVNNGIMVSSFTRKQGNLESVFMEITGNHKKRMVIAHEDKPSL